MDERTRRFPLAVPITFREFFTRVWRGCYREDGTRYWTRREWLRWWWVSCMSKWLCAPWACKRGYHRIGPESDMGHGEEGDGCRDVWCLDCDRAVRIPFDDLIGWDKANRIQGIYTHLRRGDGLDG